MVAKRYHRYGTVLAVLSLYHFCTGTPAPFWYHFVMAILLPVLPEHCRYRNGTSMSAGQLLRVSIHYMCPNDYHNHHQFSTSTTAGLYPTIYCNLHIFYYETIPFVSFVHGHHTCTSMFPCSVLTRNDTGLTSNCVEITPHRCHFEYYSYLRLIVLYQVFTVITNTTHGGNNFRNCGSCHELQLSMNCPFLLTSDRGFSTTVSSVGHVIHTLRSHSYT